MITIEKNLIKTPLSYGLFFLIFTFVSEISFGQENFCSLGEMNIVGDQSFSVEIVVSNGDTLAGFQIPFAFDYGDIQVECDSAAFAGGARQNFALPCVSYDVALFYRNQATLDAYSIWK